MDRRRLARAVKSLGTDLAATSVPPSAEAAGEGCFPRRVGQRKTLRTASATAATEELRRDAGGERNDSSGRESHADAGNRQQSHREKQPWGAFVRHFRVLAARLAEKTNPKNAREREKGQGTDERDQAH